MAVPPHPRTGLNMLSLALGAVVAILLVGCSSPGLSPSDNMASMEASISVTSTDFVAEGELNPKHSANMWGQCSGANLNPQLAWTGAPEDTATFALTVLDRSAANFSHWVQINIPSDVTSIDTGESANLPGISGLNDSPGTGYFGPCPPSPNHRYEFIVWALDTELNVSREPTYSDFVHASEGHVLAWGSITGLFSPQR